MNAYLSLLLLYCCAADGTEPLLLSVRAESVRLHPHEAWVTRTGKVRMPSAGTHKIVIGHLPGGMNLDDIRVKAKGPTGTLLGEITLSEDPTKQPDPPEAKSLLTRLEAIHLRLQTLGLQDEAAEQSIKFLSSVQQQPQGGEKQAGTTGAVDFSRQLEARQLELLTQAAARKKERTTLEEDQNKANREWQELLVRLGRDRKWAQVTLDVTCTEAGDLDVELATRTNQARWAPGYEVRVSPAGKVDWVLFATISQSSGEAWNGVRLELSNADSREAREPKRFLTLPTFSWRAPMLNAGSATVEVVASASTMDTTSNRTGTNISQGGIRGSGALNTPYTIPAPKPQPVLESGPTQLAEGKGLFSTFLLDGKKDIPPTAEPRRFMVLTAKAQGYLLVSVAPRLGPEAFRVVRFELPEDMPLFPGSPVTRVYDDQRLGVGALVIPPAGEPLEFSLGLFRGLRAQVVQESLTTPYRKSRVVAVKQVNKGGVTQSFKEEAETTGTERLWILKEGFLLSNDSTEQVLVEVQDRLLVSTHESVKVDTEESDGAQGQARPNRKCRLWTRTVPPRSTAGWTMTTRIHAPKEGEIIGLRSLGIDGIE